MHSSIAVIFLVFISAVSAAAQSPVFEVATVKLNTMTDAELRTGVRVWGCHGTDNAVDSRIPLGRCVSRGIPLRYMIAEAYGIPFYHLNALLSGGPNWLDDLYDIEGKAEKPVPLADLRRMLRALLEDRFKLTVHREKRDVPVFDLVLARGGAKVKPAPSNRECAPSALAGPCGGFTGGRGRGLSGQGVTMGQLAENLTLYAGRLVIDKTGLPGPFDVKTTPWIPDNPGPNFAPEAGGDPNDLPTLYTMLQDQLGLRLDARREMVEMVIVDRAEKPAQK